MTSINQFISEETIYALGWTVIHSFWQGLLIALVFSLCYSNMKNRSAKFKYYFSLAALFSIVIAAVVTFSAINDSIVAASPESYLVPTHTIADINHSNIRVTSQSGDWYETGMGFLDDNTSFIVFIWMLGLLAFITRMLYGFYYIKKIRFSATGLEDKKWQHLVDRFLVNLGSSKSVEVAQSALVKMPMMIGFLKPIILFPVGVVNSMDSKEVEAIIAHELSHVMRNDYLINIIQSFVEVLFYYHPAVWWISSIVRAERENSCDDMAISMTRSNVTYAKALLHLGQHNNKVNPFAMTFGGKKKKLLLRVQRILNQSQYKPRVMEKIITSTLLFVLIVGISLGANTNEISAHTLIENGSIPSDLVESPVVSTFAERPNEHHNFIEIDTLPNNENSSCQMMYYSNDVRVDVWKEDGKIVKLWVDGKRIKEADYHKYQAYIDEAPEMPPFPPAPPAPPAVPSPTAPPAPPAFPSKLKGKSGGSAEVDRQKDKIIYLRKDGDAYKLMKDNEEEAQMIKWGIEGDSEKLMLEMRNHSNNLMNAKEQNEFIRIKQQMIKDELKTLSEITFIDSLHPTLKLSDFENGALSLRIDTDDIFEDDHIQIILENRINEIENETSSLLKELENESIHLQNYSFDLLEDVNEIEDNILAIHVDVEGAMSEYQTFLNSENDRELRRLHLKNKNNQLNSTFEKELLKDGLISNPKNYNFKLSNKSFKVNGSKVDEKLKRKYLDILQSHLGISIDADVKYNRNVKPNKSTTTVES